MFNHELTPFSKANLYTRSATRLPTARCQVVHTIHMLNCIIENSTVFRFVKTCTTQMIKIMWSFAKWSFFLLQHGTWCIGRNCPFYNGNHVQGNWLKKNKKQRQEAYIIQSVVLVVYHDTVRSQFLSDAISILKSQLLILQSYSFHIFYKWNIINLCIFWFPLQDTNTAATYNKYCNVS